MSSKSKYSLVRALQEDVIPEVEEAAVNASQAKSQNLALAVFRHDGTTKAVLYYIEGNRPVALGFIRLWPISKSESGALKNTVQIKASAAEAGYGPFMYDIALGIAYPKFVMADRNSVSTEAMRVWTHYLKKRLDVERVFLPELHIELSKENKTHLDDQWFPFMVMPQTFPNEEQFLGLEKSLTAIVQSSKKERRTKELESLRDKYVQLARSSPVAWAFRMPGPATAKEGPALAVLLDRHKKNLQKNPDLLGLIVDAGHDLFDLKYEL